MTNLWVPHPGADWLIVLVAIAVHILLAALGDVPGAPSGLTLETLARTTVGVVATLLGFLLAGMIFFYQLRGGLRLEIADDSLGDRMFAAWKSGIATTGVSLVPLVLTSVVQPSYTGWLVEATLLIVGLRSVRLFRVLFDWLALYRADIKEPKIPTADAGRLSARR